MFVLVVCVGCTCCSLLDKDEFYKNFRLEWIGIDVVFQKKTWYEPFMQDAALIYRLSEGGANERVNVRA